MDLADMLGLEAREHLAFVGAGGKKTAMRHLVETAGRRNCSVGYTTTTHMPPPDGLDLQVVGPETLEEILSQSRGSLAFAARDVEDPERADEKVRGYDLETIEAVFELRRFDWLLVKADGARRRDFKAPGRGEPLIPPSATHVLPFAAVTVIGKTLDEEAVHRPERVAAITDTGIGGEVTSETVAAVLASSSGALKGVPPGATVTPILNKADTPARRSTARRTLSLALDHSERFDSGLVTSFTADYAERVTA